ncbi:interleukin-22 [Takifugu flavidus]|uniref:Interleukin-24 n=2 Tax=Takifugu TaxID=31032 RepID=A0A5C6NBV6_9TELE|nr:interleukin-22 [Takifugu flavidus]TNM91503.1 hypothetical protein fugu_019883 [Takifugu bimaculatus]TWW64934.1 hypothetical protein D4764_22G0005810 [Takifugu flavidus]
MLASTLRCSRCPAVALLALSLLIGWSEQAAVQHLHRALSPPLVDEGTYVAVEEVAKQAQREQDDPSVRLLPNIKPNQETRDLEICCIHANILDFYLNNVLPHHSSNNAHAHRLQTDLSRISRDLETHGCSINRYRDHQHAEEFSRRFFALDGRHRLNKALGEIDILFSYLQDYCIQTNVTVA